MKLKLTFIVAVLSFNGMLSQNKTFSINYRNLFLEAGYHKEAIKEKLTKTYKDLFEGPNRIYWSQK